MLYSSPLAAVWTNNNLSSYFPLHRGTRQGCPLLAVAVEPLAIALRGEPGIKGIQRNGLDNKVSLYADDMLLYPSDPLISLPKTLSLLGDFGKISGYKIDLQKSEIMPVNTAAKKIILDLFPLKVSTHKFKYLGIWVTNDFKDLFKANFTPLLMHLKQDLERWSLQPLSFEGIINTVKMNVLPKFFNRGSIHWKYFYIIYRLKFLALIFLDFYNFVVLYQYHPLTFHPNHPILF